MIAGGRGGSWRLGRRRATAQTLLPKGTDGMIELGDAVELVFDLGQWLAELAYRRWSRAGAMLALILFLIGIGVILWLIAG